MRKDGWLYIVMVLAALPLHSVASEYQSRAVIKALDRAVISGELAAKVIELPLHPGDAFSKGELLVGLDCSLYDAQKLKVASEKKAAYIKFENAEQLNQLRSIGSLEVALAQTHLNQMEAALKIAELNTERCSMRAPYDGRVVNLMTNRFENVRQQQELIEIINERRLEAEIVAPASWLEWLEPDMPVTLHIDESTLRVKGIIFAIEPAIDPVSQTVMLHVRLSENRKLIPGMSATAELSGPVAQ